ncbi:MAG: DUF2213 domain-containing protein, partial [Candidatus Bathyarchaeia archaeon]
GGTLRRADNNDAGVEVVRAVKTVYQQDAARLNPERITEYKHPVFGDVTVFHDVVIASEIVQVYNDGRAFKPREELESYAWTIDGRWVMAGGHPPEGIISNRDQVAGRTVNPRFVKDLNDPKTRRPCRAGIKADIEIFNNRVPQKILEDMKNGRRQEVSIGFFYSKDDTPGVVEADTCKGEAYDYVQRDMFHDHTAVGIDNGRCPMPYCGLGADEITRHLTSDPFAGFENFDACVTHMTKPKGEGGQGYSEETARKVCGMLQAKHEKKKKEDSELREAAKIVWKAMLEEIEALKGERDAMKKTDRVEWWREVNWAEDDARTIFDALPEETRTLIIDAGLCPECDENLPYEDEEEFDTYTLTPVTATDEYDLEQDWHVGQEVGEDKVLSYKSKAELPDSAYAYIEEGCEKKDGKTAQRCRHLLIHDPAHVRAALAALRGARTGKKPPYADKAKPKVCAAAKKFGIVSEVCGGGEKTEDVLERAARLLSP